MKIDNSGRVNSQLNTQTNTRVRTTDSSDTSSTTSASSSVVPEDTVSLSQTSQLQSVSQNMANVPVVNADKVKEIKEAIAQGKFSVNPEAIADSLIESVRDLLAERTTG